MAAAAKPRGSGDGSVTVTWQRFCFCQVAAANPSVCPREFIYTKNSSYRRWASSKDEMGESLIQVSWGRRVTLQSGTTFLRIKGVYLLPLTSHLAGGTGLHYIGHGREALACSSCACGTCWLCNLIMFLVLMF